MMHAWVALEYTIGLGKAIAVEATGAIKSVGQERGCVSSPAAAHSNVRDSLNALSAQTPLRLVRRRTQPRSARHI